MKLGAWAPDLPDFGHDGLVTCRNVYPSSAGYKPFAGLSAATGDLGADWTGGAAFIGPDGTAAMLGATAAALFSHSGGTWTSELAVATSNQWFFTQFGDIAIGTHGGTPVGYTISAGTAATLGGSPPSAKFCTVVRDFVALAGDGSAQQTVSWSEINDAEGWTEGTNQCDSQVIPDGGPIKGIAGGEFLLVFQERSINIFEYVGLPFVFTRRKISDEIGALSHGSIGRAGSMYFFLSRRGFYMFSEGGFKPIGKDRIDRTFLDTYTLSDIENEMRCTVDPERSLVIWSMPGALWIYNWDVELWSRVEIPGLAGISNGITAGATLEEVAVTYPSIEDVTPSLDDAFWRGGTPLLLLAKDDGILYTFSSGDNLEATIKTAKLEPFKGRVSHVRSARVDTDATDGIVLHIDHAMRLGEMSSRTTSADLRDSGDISIRASGRYLQDEIVIAEGTQWTYLQAIDHDGSAGGRR